MTGSGIGDAPPLEDLLVQIEAALAGNLYYLAFMATLTLPDICAGLEHASGRTDGKRYARWCDENLPDGLIKRKEAPLSGADIYAFRSTVLHQASVEQHPKRPYSRLFFLEPGANTMTAHMNLFGDALNIDLGAFCLVVTSAVRRWRDRVQETPEFQRNYARLLQRRTVTLPSVGPAVIIG